MIRLTGTKIAVDPILDSDMTRGGLYIPDIAKERADQGIVKYIGPDCKDVEIGDYVLFSGYSGSTVRLEDEGLLIIMYEEFVTCKIEPPDTEVPGVFFRDREGLYFPATYEMAIELIRLAFQDKNMPDARGNRPIGAVERIDTKPKVEEYRRG